MIKDGWKQWQSYERAHGNPIPRYSEDWESAGPIIEKDIVELVRGESDGVVYWEARAGFEDEPGHAITIGPTSLIAAMRCYVASKLGDEIEIPKELT
jgi:hypothetical protein